MDDLYSHTESSPADSELSGADAASRGLEQGLEEDLESLTCPETLELDELVHDQMVLDPPVWRQANEEHCNSLLSRDDPSLPLSIAEQHPALTASMRAILVDWMNKLCTDLLLKRETFYKAVSYLDRFLAGTYNLPRSSFQRFGVAAIYLVCKIEELYPPKPNVFVQDGRLITFEILFQMERELLCRSSWRLPPPTLSCWLNHLMTEWDDYLHCSWGYPVVHDRGTEFNRSFITFKLQNEWAYRRFRETHQILDMALLHVGVIEHRASYLTASLLYLLVNKWLRQTEFALFGEPQSQAEQVAQAHSLCECFLTSVLRVPDLSVLQPSTQFLWNFIEFTAEVNRSPVDEQMSDEYKQVRLTQAHYEDYLSFQTHLPGCLQFVLQIVG